jgi:hypothetical protein
VLAKRVTDFNTNTVCYVHDETDRLVAKVAGTNWAATPTVSFSYFPDGQRDDGQAALRDLQKKSASITLAPILSVLRMLCGKGSPESRTAQGRGKGLSKFETENHSERGEGSPLAQAS